MSSSTGVQGFGYDRYQGPSDKLKLLKSNSKYANNSADSSVSPSKSRPDTNLRDEDSEYPFGNEVSERLKNLNPPTSYAKKQEKMAKGPVRATHH